MGGDALLDQLAREDFKSYIARPVIRTQPLDESWADFVPAWSRVRCPWGSDPIGVIWQTIAEGPYLNAADAYDSPEVRRLAARCRALQQTVSAQPFLLSCRTAAQLVERDAMTAYRWLNVLVADGVLAVVKQGTAAPRGRATRYRYVGDSADSA